MKINPHNFLLMFIIMYMIIRLVKIRKQGLKFKKELYGAMFNLYVAILIAITLFPIELPPQNYHISVQNAVNWHAFNFLSDESERINKLNIIGNICMMVPFKTLFELKFNKKIPFRRYCLASLAGIISIEIIQYFENITFLSGINLRIVDINDVLFNMLGVVIGYWLWKIYTLRFFADKPESRNK